MTEKTRAFFEISGIDMDAVFREIPAGSSEESEFISALKKIPFDGRLNAFSAALLDGDAKKCLQEAAALRDLFESVRATRLRDLFARQIDMIAEGFWDLSIEIMPSIFSEHGELCAAIKKYLL